ncbi:hypothetical protein BDY17DRAFT_244194 [Neohortaea acidophila]|uniref:M protein, serotype 2.1 n=1 Tax=Neohortaea acidophila TaxID=245834 RepID=A0A6A6Q6Q0_9PEZI|nr:uncharacterized protein BDY17DRAFT_244194 [Neohortaea acidophila]KAF2487077.1 hypothetical protein BDY17DRAFT_244194 [Neohortaea acidophila]
MAPSSTPSSVSRGRSVRNGTATPVSARAAARKPAPSAGSSETDDDAKAELQARLDELQDKLLRTEAAVEESRKHGEVLQIKLDEALKEQGMLEESVHEHTQRVEQLEAEKKESARTRRELEQTYEVERSQATREREQSTAEREALTQNMQRLRETLAQRELRERAGVDHEGRPSVSRTSSWRSDDASPSQERRDRHFAPPASLSRSDSRESSKLVLQKDKIIESLRLELAEAQIKLVELENRGGGTLHQLEKDMYDVKMQNARLMEENESFQLLLSEKTLNGDLVQSDLLRVPSNTDSHSRATSSSPQKARTSLAEELEDFEGEGDINDADSSAADHRVRILRAEVNTLKDQNKALTTYINSIISRLLQHEQFEAILDKTPDLMAGPGAASRKFANHVASTTEKELPPPPPPPHQAPSDDGHQPSGFLQRAGSVLRRKPARPTSQIIQPGDQQAEEATVHQNPTTAPSIPLGRTASTRQGHRRSRSEWPAATVVTNMYKGPSPGPQGPLSPGLSAPSSRGASYFSSPRMPSPERPVRNSNRNSFNSIPPPPDSHFLDPAGLGLSTGEGSSGPSSPPLSTASSGDREAKPTGAIMMGSKPRPLRLVQEADEEKARKQANRSTWFGGWAAQAGGLAGFLPAGSGRSSEGGGSGQHARQQQ